MEDDPDLRVARGHAPAPRLVWLDDEVARLPQMTGRKGAALACALAARLPALPGFVLTPEATNDGPAAADDIELAGAWAQLSENGRRPLVVASSITEQQGNRSRAGNSHAVAGVRGWDPFLMAVASVVNGSRRGRSTTADRPSVAVLVQPLLDVRTGGVLFGLDPATGRAGRIVVVASEGESEVGVGEHRGTRYELARGGSLLSVNERPGGGALVSGELSALATLAACMRRAFAAPQDVDWAFDREGRLWVLENRSAATIAAESRKVRWRPPWPWRTRFRATRDAVAESPPSGSQHG